VVKAQRPVQVGARRPSCTVPLEDEEGVAAAGEIGRGPSDELVAPAEPPRLI
jgi:hypothetical protein